MEIPTLSLAMLRGKKVWSREGCEGQVDPCSRACSLPGSRAFAVASSALPWQLPAPGFPADLAPEPRASAASRSLLYRRSQRSLAFLPPAFPRSPSHSLFLSFPFLLFSSFFFSFGRVERPSRPRPKEVVDRRRKEISRAISRLRRATTRARPRAYTRAHTGTRYPLTHRQCVPLSYQLIAGRSLSAWDVFSHGLHFARPPPCARPRVPARPVSAQRNARRCKIAGN